MLCEHAECLDVVRRAREPRAVFDEARRRGSRVTRLDGDPAAQVVTGLRESRAADRGEAIEVTARDGPRALLIRDARAIVVRLVDE